MLHFPNKIGRIYFFYFGFLTFTVEIIEFKETSIMLHYFKIVDIQGTTCQITYSHIFILINYMHYLQINIAVIPRIQDIHTTFEPDYVYIKLYLPTLVICQLKKLC